MALSFVSTSEDWEGLLQDALDCLGLCLFTALHMFIVHKLLKFEFGTSLVTQLSTALSKRAQVGIKSASATTTTTTTTTTASL